VKTVNASPPLSPPPTDIEPELEREDTVGLGGGGGRGYWGGSGGTGSRRLIKCGAGGGVKNMLNRIRFIRLK
jgi:hypothetical protein